MSRSRADVPATAVQPSEQVPSVQDASRPALPSAYRSTGRRKLTAALPILVMAIIGLWLVPAYASQYWLFVLTGGVITIPIMQSLGVITGRVGIMSLCQLSFAIFGAWIAGWCNVHNVPGGFYVWMLLAGLGTIPVGLLIGFPALRLRGVNLAIVTFTFATATDVVFSAKQFPGTNSFDFVARPVGFSSDPGYFRFSVIVVALLFAALQLIDRSRLGASWLELRFSERGAAAHGTNTATSKLSAFAVSAFIAGIAGALIVGQVGSTTPSSFTSQTSLLYFAIAVVIGVRYWDAALVAGLAGALIPILFDKLGIAQNYVSIAFGVVAVLTLAKGKGQLGQSEMARARKAAKQAREAVAERAAQDHPLAPVSIRRPVERASTSPAAPPVLELRAVSVRFGAVTAVDSIDLSFPPASVVALIGPNGAGKSTLINAVAGFTPYTGNILLQGKPLDGVPPYLRARRGIRRSFQQLRVPPALSVGAFLRIAAGRRLTKDEVEEYLDWFGCPPAQVQIGALDVGSRRMLEVAGLVAGKPPIVLLDEPAAGQSSRETQALAERIAQIPGRTGSTVLLVEHDVDLIRAACDSLIVMDFGKVIASGPPDLVLADPLVIEAYVGANLTDATE
ncbi:MAG: ATP-binding cassette domain-containing protein [Actinomycetota bacterium]|nr:ATP-binding cassette domain-containing protein [Actinomycetota bacterium]MDQ2955756.1 ATP-binding cassette domain-containing protein [Actinomycetota bacterium]